MIGGDYWWREPGPAMEVIIYKGCVAGQAIAAAGLLAGSRRGVAVLAVTSADRLNAGWTAAQRASRRDRASARSHADRLMGAIPRDAQLVTVIDGHPATLGWVRASRRRISLPAPGLREHRQKGIPCQTPMSGGNH